MEDSFEQDSFCGGEAGCFDDEVFFGPVTAKELLVRERFERMVAEQGGYLPLLQNDCSELEEKIAVEPGIRVDYSESSVYESFSNEESKYESFNDSLNRTREDNHQEVNASQFLLEQVNVSTRPRSKKKNPCIYYCDSLEDINSLVSSMDRFSVSEEIEGINVLEKSAVCEDSLRMDGYRDQGNSSNEQCFDDDSLAIMEFDKNFDDSLDESNLPSVNHTDSLIIGKSKEDNDHSLAAKHSFKVIYENMANSNDRSDKLFDEIDVELDRASDSISEDVSKDSLEEIPKLPIHISAEKPETVTPKKKCKDFLTRKIKKSSPLSSTTNHSPVRANKEKDKFEDSIQSSQCLNRSSGPSNNQATCYDDSVLVLNDPNKHVLDSSKNTAKATETIPVLAASVPGSVRRSLSTKTSVSPKLNNTIFIDNSNIQSPVKDFLRTEDNFDRKSITVEDVSFAETRTGQNLKDTINIDDSIMHPLSIALERNSVKISELTSDSKALPVKNSKDTIYTAQCFNDTICIEDSILQVPNSDLNTKNYGPLNTPTSNETIWIDDSVLYLDALSDEIPMEDIQNHEVDLDDSFEERIKKVSLNGKFKRLGICCSSSSDEKSLEESKSGVAQSPINEILKKGITEHLLSTKNELSSPLKDKATPDQKLKLQVEVEIEADQEVNIISISSIKKGCSEKILSPNIKASSKSKLNFGFEKKNQTKRSDHKNLKGGNKKQYNEETERINNDGKHLDVGLNRFSHKDNFASNKFSEDLHIKLSMHDAKLLQALDLHDISYNYIEDGNLQSRDSIMPLNLCTRDKSNENKGSLSSRTESKENIPFVSKSSTFASKSIRNQKDGKGSPLMNTNKLSNQLNTNPEIKNSGGRSNSATKIPIRKMDNAFLVPSSNQKCLKFTNKKQNKQNQELCEETPKKHNHHFCMIRNSISKVPKSVQKPYSKKFQNIQSPIAQYIGNVLSVPSKNSDKVDGHVLVTNKVSNTQTAANGHEIHSTHRVMKK